MNDFEKNGCILVKNFIDLSLLDTISLYLENKIRREEFKSDSHNIYVYYADPLIEVLLNKKKAEVSEITGKNLIPTYSFLRLYQPGQRLTKHVDRPSCEVSVTVNIACKEKISPFFVSYKNNETLGFLLNPGDAVVYKGCEAFHWRDEVLDDELIVQFMLHYVDRDGPYFNRCFDGRPSLGFPESIRPKWIIEESGNELEMLYTK